MLMLNDGRSELFQWDTGRKMTVDADCSQVHFSNKVFGRSIDVDVVDGVATIPDILLQTDKELTAWAFVGTAENGYTKISKVFKVNKRNKPANYVFTAPDQTTLGEILDRIEDLENRPSGDVSKEDIQNAVSDYLDKNPVSVEEKDPTVPAWAKQPEPPKVEIPEVDIPDTLPNPHKLTFTGAVNAEYDGSKEVTVEIPEGGGGGIEVTGAEVGQTIVVKAVDENGKPTEWETADLPPEWEVIADITTTEEVNHLIIDQDSSGKAFELDEIEVMVYAEKLAVTESWYFYIGEDVALSRNMKLATNVTVVCRYKSGIPFVVEMYQYGYDFKSSTLTREPLDSYGKSVPVKIDCFRMQHFSNGVLPIGTHIVVTGRRKKA